MNSRASSVFPGRGQPQTLRVGVIGVGNMGQHHTRVLSLLKDVELIGVSDLDRERGIDTASKYQVQFFHNYRFIRIHQNLSNKRSSHIDSEKQRVSFR